MSKLIGQLFEFWVHSSNYGNPWVLLWNDMNYINDTEKLLMKLHEVIWWSQDRPDCYKGSCAREVSWVYCGISGRSLLLVEKPKINLHRNTQYFLLMATNKTCDIYLSKECQKNWP